MNGEQQEENEMILTVTMNTSIDRLYMVDRVTPETVMRVREVHNTPGGKGMNVSRVARKLREPVTAAGFTGGFHGQYLEQMLAETGVTPDFTHVKTETRSCINIWDLSDNRSTEYLEPGAPVTAEELDRFLTDFSVRLPSADAVTISGSVPAGVPKDIYARLIARCRERNVPVLLDTSGELLREGVKAVPTLVKPNEDEIGAISGCSPENREETVRALKGLVERGIRYAVLSLGAEGAILASAEGLLYGRPPRVVPKNTVGCGDSMLAGFAVGIARRLPIRECFRMALAVSAASAMNLLTGDFDEPDYQDILPRVEIRETGGTE